MKRTKNTRWGRVALVMTMLAGLGLGGCQDEKLKEACTDSCAQRIACDKEKGHASTSQGNCETACLLQGDDFVDKHDDCSGKESCEYTTCMGQ